MPDEFGGRELDVCRACQLVWCDDLEHEALPQLPPALAPDDGLPPAVRQQMAVEMVLEAKRLEQVRQAEGPDFSLRKLPAVLGVPVELHPTAMPTLPWLTWATAIATAVVSIEGLWHDDIRRSLWLVPEQSGPFDPRLLTVFLVHADWLHLLCNLCFLITFGDDVEVRLGRGRWFALLLGATLAGSLLHVAIDPHSVRPCVGASGGISGLIVCYALLLPDARLGAWIGRGYRSEWVTFPASSGLLIWAGLQVALLLQQLSGFGRISAAAHIGGALVGVAAWAAWRARG